MCIQETLKMCKFSLMAPVQKSMQNFFAKIVHSDSLLFETFQRALKCIY